MKLTQAETIQVMRRRSGMNQGTFGAKAFDTSYESGRTKIKNIELGKQKPTPEDIRKMAEVLEVSREVLLADQAQPGREAKGSSDGILLTRQCLGLFPGLDAYVDMLNKAVKLGDEELIVYIADKISDLFKSNAHAEAVNL